MRRPKPSTRARLTYVTLDGTRNLTAIVAYSSQEVAYDNLRKEERV